MLHVAHTDLEAGLEELRRSPRDRSTIDLIVRRPAENEREILTTAELDPALGLVGDTWLEESADRDMQLTLVNSRVARLIAGPQSRWSLSGDQLFADFDISVANLPPGTMLAVGAAMLEVTGKPHTGCSKYAERFGRDAARFVNSPDGRALNLRGINTRIVGGGVVRVGDAIEKKG